MKYIFALFLVFAFSSFPSTVFAKQWSDIAYGSLDEQKLDIYASNTKSNAPVMVFVHGGGWHIGQKERVHKKPEAFNNKGFIFISVEYPMLPDHPVKTQAQSIAMAISWVTQNIHKYGGNPHNIHIMGHSAGAHLVSLVAADPGYLEHQGASVKNIQSVTSVDGASLNIPWKMRTLNESGSFIRRMFKNTFGNNPRRWKDFSPYHHLSQNRYIPPFLFLTAEEKTASNIAAEGFEQKLKSFGTKTKVAEITGRNHSSINRKMGTKSDPAFKEIMSFVSY